MYDMKRTTIFIDETLERRLKQKARREGKSVAQCVREAVAAYVAVPLAGGRGLPSIVAMFKGGPPDDASRRVDEIIAEAMRRQGPHT
jgi:predicted transcriptional regulator